MKKITFVLATLCFALQMQAQSFKHELKLSFGFGDEPHLNSVKNDYVKQFKLEEDASAFGLFLGINYAFNMEYLYHFSPKWAVGVDISYTEAAAKGAHLPWDEQLGNNPYLLLYGGIFFSIFPNDELNLSSKAWTFMPEAKYTWLDNGHFTLYSKGGLGLRYYRLQSESSHFPNIKEEKIKVAYQLSPVGIEIGGNHVRFTSELGYGQQGILNMGIVVYFGRK